MKDRSQTGNRHAPLQRGHLFHVSDRRGRTARRAPRPALATRRAWLEPLEDRRLLDVGITSFTQQSLLNGLQCLVSWADRVESFDRLARPLDIIQGPQGSRAPTLGELSDFSELLRTRLLAPAQQYFAGIVPGTGTTEGLATATRRCSTGAQRVSRCRRTGTCSTSTTPPMPTTSTRLWPPGQTGTRAKFPVRRNRTRSTCCGPTIWARSMS